MIIKLPNGDDTFSTCEFYGKGGIICIAKFTFLIKTGLLLILYDN